MKTTLVILAFITISLSPYKLISQPGSLDPTFDTDGMVITSTGNGVDDVGNDLLVQTNGKIILAGYSSYRIGIVRYNTNGSLDNTFGQDGIVTTPFGNENINTRGAALQNDGKILVAGRIFGAIYDDDFIISRYNDNGTLDSTFGIDGIVITDIGSNDIAHNIDLQSDGKIIAAGHTFGDFAIARYNTDGSIDSTFGDNGLLITGIQDSFDILYDVTVCPDGLILACGTTNLGNVSDEDFVVLRINQNGTLDHTFGSSGLVITDFNEGSRDVANSIKRLSDNKIIVGGHSKSNANKNFALAKYNPDGSLDQSFNSTGKLTTDLGSIDDIGNDLAIQPDGKILLAGSSYSATDQDYVIVRYNNDGTIDNSFGLDGIARANFGSRNDIALAINLAPDGKIVVGGCSFDGKILYNFSVARFLNDISMDLIEYNINSSRMEVYPNPVFNTFNLVYEIETDAKLSLKLIDCSGKLIKNFFLNKYTKKGIHNEKLLIDSSIKPGSYILSLNDGNYKRALKIIIK